MGQSPVYILPTVSLIVNCQSRANRTALGALPSRAEPPRVRPARIAGAVPYKEPCGGKECNVADDSPRRSAAQPEEALELREILQVEVPRDRVERLKGLTRVDDPNVSDEVFDYLIRQQAQSVNIQYARFLSGVQFTEADVHDLLVDAIDSHTHGGSDPFERLLLEDEIGMDYTRAGLRAMVVKTWYTPSASRNALVQKYV